MMLVRSPLVSFTNKRGRPLFDIFSCHASVLQLSEYSSSYYRPGGFDDLRRGKVVHLEEEGWYFRRRSYVCQGSKLDNTSTPYLAQSERADDNQDFRSIADGRRSMAWLAWSPGRIVLDSSSCMLEASPRSGSLQQSAPDRSGCMNLLARLLLRLLRVLSDPLLNLFTTCIMYPSILK